MSQQTAQTAKEAPKKAVAKKDMSRAAWTWKEMKRNWAAYIMVAPFMIVFTLFTVVPVLLSIVVSFTDFNILQMPNFVFLDNYIRLFFSVNADRLPRILNHPPYKIFFTTVDLFHVIGLFAFRLCAIVGFLSNDKTIIFFHQWL